MAKRTDRYTDSRGREILDRLSSPMRVMGMVRPAHRQQALLSGILRRLPFINTVSQSTLRLSRFQEFFLSRKSPGSER